MKLHVLITDNKGKEERIENVSHIKVTPEIAPGAYPNGSEYATLFIVLDLASGGQSQRYGREFNIIHAEGV